MKNSSMGINGSDSAPRHEVMTSTVKIAILFSIVAFSCFLLYHSAYPFRSAPTSYQSPPESEEVKLTKILREAAMEDNTIILTTLNEAWAAQNSIIDIFLESFRVGINTSRLLNHLVIIALDQKAYARCMTLHPHCYALTTIDVNFSRDAYFMTPAYLKMMWRRIEFLGAILQLGYSFVFTDADIMWFRDPFPRFYPDTDFQIACDHFDGNSTDIHNWPNGGFNYVKSTNKTIQFYDFWYASRETYPGLHDQDVLNSIKENPFVSEIGLQLRFLDTAYFGGFCERSEDFNRVCTMHANCCFGLDSKVHDLRIMLDDWRKFMSSSPSEIQSNPPHWSVPQNCSTLHFNPPKEDDEPGGNK